MEWERVRAHYEQCFADTGRTQQAVAEAGGLPTQSAIQKILVNHKMGPSVETFLKAVLGLGLSLSTFFADLEQQQPSPPIVTSPPVTRDASLGDRLRQLELALAALSSTPGRLHESPTPVPSPGHVITITNVAADHLVAEAVAQMLRPRVDQVLAHIQRTMDGLVRDLQTHGTRDSDPAGLRPHHRRHRRKTA